MRNPWFIYILARIGIFVAILAALLLLGFDPFFSAMVAAVVGLAISLLFLQNQRERVSKSVYNMVNRDTNAPTAENAEDHLEAGSRRHLEGSDYRDQAEER